MDYEEIMKLNAKDFRKSLEEKKKQKKATELSFMRMQQDLQDSIERKSECFENIASLAADAALDGQNEVGLDIDVATEYKEQLNRFGFNIDYKEIQPFLGWENDAYDVDETPDENSSYSLLNPIKLRFINSEAGDKFFSKISAEINEKTDDLKSMMQFEFIVDEKERRISFEDGEFIEVPLGANDLLHIFQKMSFHASYKERAIKGKSVTTFKIKF